MNLFELPLTLGIHYYAVNYANINKQKEYFAVYRNNLFKCPINSNNAVSNEWTEGPYTGAIITTWHAHDTRPPLTEAWQSRPLLYL